MAKVTIVDVGGQYCHLIARRIRELGVYSEIVPFDIPIERLRDTKGIIISGGPHSVYDPHAPKIDTQIFTLPIPILGICYGHQLIAHVLGGRVKKGEAGEYGLTELEVKFNNTLFKDINPKEMVWMSHGDVVVNIPDGFEVLGSTSNSHIAAIGDLVNKKYGIQFHPEVIHTPCGTTIFKNFLFDICNCKANWKPKNRINNIIQEIKKKAKGKNIFFLISGGVDSTVAFILCRKALGKKKVFGLYIDTGFMRKGESTEINQNFKGLDILDNVHILDSSNEFFESLNGIYDPEEKRKLIGNKFLAVQENGFENLKLSGGNWLLGQGTIYPDTIESAGTSSSSLIKTHHNRVEIIHTLIEKGNIIEPLKEFYKDEIREIAKELGLPEKIVKRSPFPGPGLAIRCLCSPIEYSTKFDNNINKIVKDFKLHSALIPIRTVGVQGDNRTYNNLVALSGNIDFNLLENISTSITSQVPNINRVVYLIFPNNIPLENFKIKKSFITKERINLLREVDYIVTNFMGKSRISSQIWQFPVILFPLSVNKGESIALRPVNSKDGMTAEYTKIPHSFLNKLSEQILKLNNIDAVFYDITNKPPATIEWE